MQYIAFAIYRDTKRSALVENIALLNVLMKHRTKREYEETQNKLVLGEQLTRHKIDLHDEGA